MAEKKITKKVTKKTEEVVEKKVAKKVEEKEKTPVVTHVVTNEELIDDIAEEEISKEIAEAMKENTGKPDRYFEAIGRRKTAVARVRLFTRGDKDFLVNDKSYKEYFLSIDDQETAVSSMKKMKCLDKFRVTVVVKGGGHHAQAEAIRHGTARVLVDFNNNFRKRLRKAGFLTRDPRMRERKKFGLKRARKSPQWAKR
jgi:small subunit ribosomal protein S9